MLREFSTRESKISDLQVSAAYQGRASPKNELILVTYSPLAVPDFPSVAREKLRFWRESIQDFYAFNASESA